MAITPELKAAIEASQKDGIYIRLQDQTEDGLVSRSKTIRLIDLGIAKLAESEAVILRRARKVAKTR